MWNLKRRLQRVEQYISSDEFFDNLSIEQLESIASDEYKDFSNEELQAIVDGRATVIDDKVKMK